MEPMIICPKCDKLVKFSYYFGGYRCSCGWRHDVREKEKKLCNNCQKEKKLAKGG